MDHLSRRTFVAGLASLGPLLVPRSLKAQSLETDSNWENVSKGFAKEYEIFLRLLSECPSTNSSKASDEEIEGDNTKIRDSIDELTRLTPELFQYSDLLGAATIGNFGDSVSGYSLRTPFKFLYLDDRLIRRQLTDREGQVFRMFKDMASKTSKLNLPEGQLYMQEGNVPISRFKQHIFNVHTVVAKVNGLLNGVMFKDTKYYQDTLKYYAKLLANIDYNTQCVS